MRLLDAMSIALAGTPGAAGIHYNVDTTTYLADAKNVYGAIQDQVNTETAFMNLLGDGSKFGKPISQVGIRGYTFLARLLPNFNLGYRPEGTGGLGNGLANAGNQGLANSTVLLKYAYVPIVITGQANELTKGDKRAFMQAKALEAKFDMKDIVAHVNVVMVGDERGGQMAQVAISTDATHFTVSSASNLPLAKYLRVGMPIDSGPVGGGKTVTGLVITTINYATGAIVVDNTNSSPAATAVAVGDAIYLAGELPPTTGAFPYTAEGLVSLVTSTGAVQGLNPATSGQAGWQAYVEDMAAGTISSQAIMRLKQFVKNRSGAAVDCLIFPSSQINQLVGIATTLLYFQTQPGDKGVGKKALDLGYTVYTYGGIPIIEEKDGRDDRIYALACEMWKKFEALPLSMADDEAGDWTRVSGTAGMADAVAGLLRWYHQLGTLQRNSAGVQKNYAVPAAFNNQPPSF